MAATLSYTLILAAIFIAKKTLQQIEQHFKTYP